MAETTRIPMSFATATPDADALHLHVKLHVDVVVIGAEIARRRANVWLLYHAGNLLSAEAPMLVFGEPLVWRVDVILSSPTRGRIGWLGRLDVNAITGEVLADVALGEDFAARAERLPLD